MSVYKALSPFVVFTVIVSIFDDNGVDFEPTTIAMKTVIKSTKVIINEYQTARQIYQTNK